MKCNICGGDSYKVLYHGREGKNYRYYSSGDYGRIVKCNNCGLIYITPRDKNIARIYENIEDKDYLKSEETRIENFKRDLKKIERYKKKGRILDVGCGPGLFLKVSKNRGWDSYGVELSKWAHRHGKDLGLNIMNKSLEDANFESNFFDVITMWDLIEHVEDPSGLLKEANRVLKENGLLILNTPNIGSLFAKIMSKRWWNLMRMHIYYFDRKSIKRLLEKNGFQVLKIKSYSRIIMPKYAVEWLKNNKGLYKFFKFILNKTFLGNIKLSVNFYDNIVVYSRKI